MNLVKAVLPYPFVLFSMVPGTGCTLLGYMAGHALDDHARGGPQVNNMQEIGKLEPGQTLVVFRRNGDTVEGTYCGLLDVAAEEYGLSFAPIAHLMEDGKFPPALGVPINSITNREGVTNGVRGTFAGFDPARLYILTADAIKREQIPIGTIATIVDTSRNVIQGDVVRSAVEKGALPSMSTMALVVFGRQNDTLHIPIQEIAGLETPDGFHAKYIGLAAGAAVDVLVIILIQNAGGVGTPGRLLRSGDDANQIDLAILEKCPHVF